MDHLNYLKNEKCYKPETLQGVRIILQDLKKFQVDITAFAWLPWQSLIRLVLFLPFVDETLLKTGNFYMLPDFTIVKLK